jgi:8-amino-7-oxononanoate synthase
MTGKQPLFLDHRLTEAQGLHQLRSLKLRQGSDFSSNDYLGFSEDEELCKRISESFKTIPLGATGSRLLRGNLALHESVERDLAEFCGADATLLFPSGYQANIGLLSAILTESDHVFSDESNHASIIDGIRLGRARKHVFRHNDTNALQQQLKAVKDNGSKFIVTESLFSMSGDQAPLEQLAMIAHEYGAFLIVDESHATGVYGDFSSNRGGGLVQQLKLRECVFATIHTGGKALGVGGAWIAGSSLLRDYLINFSRPFIFSTAITPRTTAALGAAVQYWLELGRQRALEIRELSRHDSRGDLPETTFPEGPILSLIIGSNEKAIKLSRRLQNDGFDVRAIRPPTVAEGSARLRITLNWSIPRSEALRLTHALLTLPEALEIEGGT